MASCQKEHIKPFKQCHSNNQSAPGLPGDERGGDEIIDNSAPNGDQGDGGITDGGGSSENDQRGKPKKN